VIKKVTLIQDQWLTNELFCLFNQRCGQFCLITAM